MFSYKSFGEELKEVRTKQGLTVQMLAKACGVSRSYITLIETGKRAPGKKILSKIAMALHLETEVVLNWYLVDISHKIQKGMETP